jgi:hypothetical protein
LIFSGLVGVMFALHYAGMVALLNGMMAPLIAFLGLIMGILGFFERDKKRMPALLGMAVNAGFLVAWVLLLIQSMAYHT